MRIDAGNCADIFAAPAEDRGATQHNGRDRGEQIRISHRLGRLARVAGQQDAAER